MSDLSICGVLWIHWVYQVDIQSDGSILEVVMRS